jgi:hypothetical protein
LLETIVTKAFAVLDSKGLQRIDLQQLEKNHRLMRPPEKHSHQGVRRTVRCVAHNFTLGSYHRPNDARKVGKT